MAFADPEPKLMAGRAALGAMRGFTVGEDILREGEAGALAMTG